MTANSINLQEGEKSVNKFQKSLSYPEGHSEVLQEFRHFISIPHTRGHSITVVDKLEEEKSHQQTVVTGMLQISQGTKRGGRWRSRKSNNLLPNFTFGEN